MDFCTWAVVVTCTGIVICGNLGPVGWQWRRQEKITFYLGLDEVDGLFHPTP